MPQSHCPDLKQNTVPPTENSWLLCGPLKISAVTCSDCKLIRVKGQAVKEIQPDIIDADEEDDGDSDSGDDSDESDD